MEVIGQLNHQTLYPQELLNRKMDKGHRRSWWWKKTSMKEKHLSLNVHSCPALRTSRRRVRTQNGGTLAAKSCMPYNPSNIAVDALTCVIVVEAQLRGNEKKKFLTKEDQAVPYTKPQTMPVAVWSRVRCRFTASRLLESRVRIPLKAGVFVVCSIPSGLCEEPIARSEVSYRTRVCV